MKTILVLTDFSENAKHAAKSALLLSENLHTNILLLNSFVMVPTTPYYAGNPVVTESTMWYDEESKSQLQKLAEYLEAGYDNEAEGQYKPKITYESTEGNLGRNVEDIIKHKKIKLVVMGTKSGGTLDHILMGSDTNSVIQHSNRPVLVIPTKSNIKNIQKVIFATDFNEADIKALDYLQELQASLHFEITVVHVSLNNEEDLSNFGQEVIFASMISALRESNIGYEAIRGKDVVNRLNRFCHDNRADVIALVHYKNSFLSRILEGSTTKHALSHQNTPLLIIPSKLN